MVSNVSAADTKKLTFYRCRGFSFESFLATFSNEVFFLTLPIGKV